MSYILDALKKSEAERTRGVAPSLLVSRQDQLKSRAGLWVLFAALLINACLGGYWLYERGEPAAPQPIVAAPPATTATPAVTAQPNPTPIVEQQPPIPPPAASQNIPVEPTPIVNAAPRAAPRSQPASNEMELANLTFSTHVYASDPTKRAVTLNGRRLVEGDSINQSVLLKEITETGVILEVNGRDVPLEVLQDWH